MTTTFHFAGTFVGVVGSLGSVDVYGVPTTTYAIDGSVVDTYTAPVLSPGLFRPNETFFDSPTLEPGNHTLVITNVNGTSPNVVWLDYVLLAEFESTPSSTSSATPSSSTTSASLQSSGSPSVQGPHRSSTGAIVGGVLGGVAGLAFLIGVLVWWLVQRRRARATAALAYSGKASSSDMRPFDAWAPAEPPQAPHRPTLPPALNSYATPAAPAASSIGPGSALSRWPTQPESPHPLQVHAFDNSKDVVSFDSELTAGLGAHMDEGATGSSPPPPYMR